MIFVVKGHVHFISKPSDFAKNQMGSVPIQSVNTYSDDFAWCEYSLRPTIASKEIYKYQEASNYT